MNLFKEVLEELASGVVSEVSERLSLRSAGNVVNACCQQLGWTIDERLNAREVYLHFNDPIFGIRKVLVSVGDQGTLVCFTVCSGATIPASQVPSSALGYLLQRNCQLFVAWQMSIRDSGDVAFALNYCALASGLNPSAFKTLCEIMVKEAHEFDAKLDEAGLLR